MKPRVAILGSDEKDLAYLWRAVKDDADIVGVLIERPVARGAVLRRRIRRFGLVNALGQALFVLFAQPWLRFVARARIRELDPAGALPPPSLVRRMDSVNGPDAASLIRSFAPSFVLVYGTRLISSKILEAVGIPFINIHAGITPWYRGGQGLYWALAEGRPDRAGVTVHRIDAGIDTGAVLAQAIIEPGPTDSFVTYALLQRARGAALVRELLQTGDFAQPLPGVPDNALAEQGALYAHPTLGGYLYRRIRRGVR